MVAAVVVEKALEVVNTVAKGVEAVVVVPVVAEHANPGQNGPDLAEPDHVERLISNLAGFVAALVKLYVVYA